MRLIARVRNRHRGTQHPAAGPSDGRGPSLPDQPLSLEFAGFLYQGFVGRNPLQGDSSHAGHDKADQDVADHLCASRGVRESIALRRRQKEMVGKPADRRLRAVGDGDDPGVLSVCHFGEPQGS